MIHFRQHERVPSTFNASRFHSRPRRWKRKFLESFDGQASRLLVRVSRFVKRSSASEHAREVVVLSPSEPFTHSMTIHVSIALCQIERDRRKEYDTKDETIASDCAQRHLVVVVQSISFSRYWRFIYRYLAYPGIFRNILYTWNSMGMFMEKLLRRFPTGYSKVKYPVGVSYKNILRVTGAAVSAQIGPCCLN